MPFQLATIAILLGFGVYAAIAKLRGGAGAGSEPWRGGESIYEFIQRAIDDRTGAMADSTATLPDENKRYKPGETRWVAGGRDGAVGHHTSGAPSEAKATQAVNLLTRIAQKGASTPQRELYALLQDDSVLEFLDATLRKLAGQRVLRSEHVRAFARSVATTSPDRGPVKFAIALLGVIRSRADVEVIALLGRHEEFTLYAAVALTNALPHPEDELFELARSVHGWGRIQTVERLANTGNPTIKRWLLREGYNNSIMPEYLALVCAEGGELHAELATATVDAEVLQAATDLIAALLAGGPSGSLDDYEHAARVAQDYLRHILAAPLQLRQFLTVRSLQEYLKKNDWDANARQKNGWTAANRESALAEAAKYFGRSEWPDLVRRQLSADAPEAFAEADSVAAYLNIDTWPIHWDRLVAAPENPGRWSRVMSLVDAERIGKVLDLAAAKLPLEKIATGPALATGLGPEFQPHSALDYILQSLGPFSGKGKPLVLAGLRSPVIRNRNFALKTLAAWNASDRDSEIATALAQARTEEPDPDVKKRIEQVIAGQPLE